VRVGHDPRRGRAGVKSQPPRHERIFIPPPEISSSGRFKLTMRHRLLRGICG
jgi:hypothetical protein